MSKRITTSNNKHSHCIIGQCEQVDINDVTLYDLRQGAAWNQQV